MIEVEHLSKIYGSTAAIQDITFHVEKGEILGFLGPNGAGKTTTMRILAGYIPATTGTAKIASYDVHENSMEVRQRIGYLPENPPLYPDMTVEGFLHFVAKIKGVSSGDRPERVKSAIARCQLEDKTKIQIRKLSKGYKQRVGIAQAIVHDPPAIILDEPTSGLDPRQMIEVRNLIKNLAGDHTIILSTHILPEVSMTCDRVTIINKGKVVATDSPMNLMGQLTGGCGYELEIDGDPQLLQPLLQVIPGVSLVEINPEVKRLPHKHQDQPKTNSFIRITTVPDTEPGRDIAAVVINTGIGLYEMRRTYPSLEDVFLELTTKDPEIEDHQPLNENDNEDDSEISDN
jgi:ABC-2 type transport system ATP-binding protein